MVILHGVSGHLLSSAFLAATFAGQPTTQPEDQARRRFFLWHESIAPLGPASTPRAILQAGAAPLFALLGFEPPHAVEPVGEAAIVATLTCRERAVALVVAAWGGPLDSLWREAVTQARRRGADWCVLFDARRIRIVDATRLYARRYFEIDLDAAAEQRETFVALWRTCHARPLTSDEGEPRSLRAHVARRIDMPRASANRCVTAC